MMEVTEILMHILCWLYCETQSEFQFDFRKTKRLILIQTTTMIRAQQIKTTIK